MLKAKEMFFKGFYDNPIILQNIAVILTPGCQFFYAKYAIFKQ